MRYAAIAQPVERILGKDEVASSNLASSSKKKVRPKGWTFFLAIDRFERLNAARTSAAGDGLTEPNHYFCPKRAKCKQIWLAAPQKSLEPQRVLGFLLFCAVYCLLQKPTQKPTRLCFSMQNSPFFGLTATVCKVLSRRQCRNTIKFL